MKSPVLMNEKQYVEWADKVSAGFVAAPQSYPCIVICDAMANWIETVYYHEFQTKGIKMINLSWRVSVEGKVVENGHDNEKGEFEDFTTVESIDSTVKDIQKRWGENCDIKLHVWRANWSS